MYGFKKVELSDHEFAAYLREEGAIDNYHHAGDSVQWCKADGRLVAVAIFDNAACTRDVYVPEDREISQFWRTS